MLTWFVLSALLLGGCFRDEVPSSQFVSDFEMHFSYGEFGNGRPFSTPLSVLMTNTTEQLGYSFESGTDGVVAVSRIMPGQYTVTVSGSLTAKEGNRSILTRRGNRSTCQVS